jgi:hypothetical protein
MSRAPSALWRREDFGDLTDSGTLDRFLRQLNAFAKQVESALTRGLTFSENLLTSWREVTITTDGAGALPVDSAGKSTLVFPHLLPSAKPRAVTLERATKVDASTKAETQVTASSVPAWTEGNGQITVSALAGLTASTQYRLLFLVKG